MAMIMSTLTMENGVESKTTATQKRRLRKKKNRAEQRQRRDDQTNKEATGNEEEEETASKNGLPDGVEVKYVSAPRDFTTFFIDDGVGETPNGAGPSTKHKSDSDTEMEEKPRGRRRRRPRSRSSSEEPIDGLAAVNQVELEKEFNRIFNRFVTPEELTRSKETMNEKETTKVEKGTKSDAPISSVLPDDDNTDMDMSDDEVKMSKKKRKLQNQMKIGELKQVCQKPEVVEVWDVTAADPRTLVFLKSYRNAVPVPRHWSQKRKYLQGKRGIEKPSFKLPEYIEATGISLMRQTYHEKEESKKLKQKQKDKMRPRMGRLDIDYRILHDAFFKYQTKPNLSGMGELYYEGKEYEAKVKNIKPGILSEELRKALGMAETSPPPWLINMQRYGPPPSYPSLKVPGLNAPIPPNSTFGYQTGGWGKPPVDEQGNPIYGDVFGENAIYEDSDLEVDKVTSWGDLDSEAEETSDEEEEDEELPELPPEEPPEEPETEEETASIDESAVTGTLSVASGFASSLPSGLETPDAIDLRKASDKAVKQLYTVLEQKHAAVDHTTLMGSDHVYVVPDKEKWPVGVSDRKRNEALQKVGGSSADVEVSMDPAEIEGLDEDQIQQLYAEKLKEARSARRKEDCSDMVAAKAAQQKRKVATKKDNFKF